MSAFWVVMLCVGVMLLVLDVGFFVKRPSFVGAVGVLCGFTVMLMAALNLTGALS